MKKLSKKQLATIDTCIVYVGLMSSGEYDEFHTQTVSAGTYYPLVLSLLKNKKYQYNDTDRRKWIEVYQIGSQTETIEIEELEK